MPHRINYKVSLRLKAKSCLMSRSYRPIDQITRILEELHFFFIYKITGVLDQL